jgi:hypothetical protein
MGRISPAQQTEGEAYAKQNATKTTLNAADRDICARWHVTEEEYLKTAV